MPSSKRVQFDPLTSDASDLQVILETQRELSRTLIENYLYLIERHNQNGLHLRAVQSLVPEDVLVAQADQLDSERANGSLRSPLHGIPIDNIITGQELQVPTTLGSFAFENAMGKKNAAITQKLIDAGLVILGKTSMTEFCGLKGSNLTTGWSPLNKQVQSPYIRGGVADGDLIFRHTTPGGSSSGSAVSIAAGFSPLAIGTETDGSVIGPAHRAGLYALKPPRGTIPMEGVFSLTRWDSAGVMGKSPGDLAELLNILMEPKPNFDVDALRKTSWSSLKVGFVDPVEWRLPGSICAPEDNLIHQMEDSFVEIKNRIEKEGARVVFPVSLPDAEDLAYGIQNGAINKLTNHDLGAHVEYFASCLSDPKVKSLSELVKFIDENKDLELPPEKPDQSGLKDALDDQSTDQEVNDIAASVRHQAGPNGVLKALIQNDIDVIVLPGDSAGTTLGTCAGYPVGAVPAGILSKYGRPFGVTLLAKAGDEAKLFEFMHVYKATFPSRPVPLIY